MQFHSQGKPGSGLVAFVWLCTVFASNATCPAKAESNQSSAYADSMLKPWYRQPAPNWLEALPVGNGRVGTMVLGGINRERKYLHCHS